MITLGMSFAMSINMLRNQASRVMFALLSKTRFGGRCTVAFLDSLGVPITTYGCEVCGFRNIEVIEMLHL